MIDSAFFPPVFSFSFSKRFTHTTHTHESENVFLHLFSPPTHFNIHCPISSKDMATPCRRLWAVLAVAALLAWMADAEDDTEGLRSMLGNLCTLNTVGTFASCCLASNNGAHTTLAGGDCFAEYILSLTGTTVQGLFVAVTAIFPPCNVSNLQNAFLCTLTAFSAAPV